MFSKTSSPIGQFICAARKRAGLSQEALAERLHVTRQTISNWEGGKSLPDIESLKSLAEALEVPVERLLYGEISPPQDKLPSAVGILCTYLGTAVLVAGLLYGIRNGYSISPMERIVYNFSDTLPIWIFSLLWGAALLGIGKIIKLLER